MNKTRILGHLAGATAFATLWEVAIQFPAGDPGWPRVAAGAGPYVIAGVSLLLQHMADPTPQPRPSRLPAPRTRRALTAAREGAVR